MKYTTHTEDFIEELFVRMDILTPHQLNFHKITLHLGIQLFYWADKSQALFLKEQVYIFLNEKLSDQQQWQDFCHELAHVLLNSGHQGRMSPYSLSTKRTRQTTLCIMLVFPLSCWMR